VRRQAKQQLALAREQARRVAAAGRAPRVRRSASEAWLDAHDARRPWTRADLRSGNDELAEPAVAAGGGLEAVLEATGLRTRANVLRLIDPAILVRAFENDAAASAAAQPQRERLRRLVPDRELLRRRAAGEPLRRLAGDYAVAHTTLGRYLARPTVKRQLRELAPRLPPAGAGGAGRNGAGGGEHELLRKRAEERAATMRRSSCPVHGRPPTVRVVDGADEYRIEASFCCARAKKRALQALRSEADCD